MINFIIKRYYLQDIKYGDVKSILRKYVKDYRNNFINFITIVEWKIFDSNNSEVVIKANGENSQVRQFLNDNYSGVRFLCVECASEQLK